MANLSEQWLAENAPQAAPAAPQGASLSDQWLAEQQAPAAPVEPPLGSPAATTQANAGPSMGDKLMDWAKGGLANAPRSAAALASLVHNALNPAQMILKGQLNPFESAATAPAEQVAKQAEGVLGVQNLTPSSNAEKVIKAGVQAVTDPTTYLGPMPAIRRTGEVAKRTLGTLFAKELGYLGQSATLGAAGGAGGETARQLAEAGGAGQVGQTAAAIVGGAGSAIGTGIATGAAREGAMQAQRAWDARSLAKGATQDLADAKTTDVVRQAMSADPNLAQNLDQNVTEGRRLGITEMPSTVASGGNPVLQGAAEQMAADPRSAAGRAALQSRYTAGQGQLDARINDTYGQAPEQATALAAKPPVLPGILRQQADQKTAALDNQAQQVSKPYTGNDPVETGRAIGDNLEGRLKAAQKEYGGRIQAAVDEGTAKGIALPQATVRRVVEDIKGIRDENFMDALPDSLRRTMGKATKGEIVPGSADRPDRIGWTELDKIDAGLNKALRNARDDNTRWMITDAKRSVREAMEQMDPETYAKYVDAKKGYDDAVAGPFLRDVGNRTLDRAKWDAGQTTALRNPEVIESFIANDTTGQAVPLARAALLQGLEDAAGAGGSIDPVKMAGWMHKNRAALDRVPGLRQELTSTQQAAASIADSKTAVTNALAESLEAKVLSVEGQSAQQIAQRLLSNPENVAKFRETYGNGPEAIQAARSIVAQRLLREGDPAAVLKANPDWSRSVKELYGLEAQDIEALAKLRTAFNKADISDVRVRTDVSAKTMDPLERQTGVTLPFVFSQMRNRVVSPPQKVVNILSKALFNKADTVVDEQVQRLLLDPKALRNVVKSITDGTAKDGTIVLEKVGEFMGKYQKGFKERLRDYALSGAGMSGRAARSGLLHEQSGTEVDEGPNPLDQFFGN